MAALPIALVHDGNHDVRLVERLWRQNMKHFLDAQLYCIITRWVNREFVGTEVGTRTIDSEIESRDEESCKDRINKSARCTTYRRENIEKNIVPKTELI